MAVLNGLTVSDTGSIELPSGTTAQRPVSPEQGMTRYNTDLNVVEVYDGSSWKTLENEISSTTTGDVLTSEIVDNGKRYRVHQFMGTGSFTPSAPGYVEYLIVAGGGGGGCWVGGGAGGGGYQAGVAEVTNTTYPIQVGGGGTGEFNPGSYGGMPIATNGGDSVAFGVTASGGGRGGSWSSFDAFSGGSGGGEGYSDPRRSGTAGQGFPGGVGRGDSTNGYPTGGGGGARGQGGDWTTTKSGSGGPGIESRITGYNRHYAGGGGGGYHGSSSNADGGDGGIGGGGMGDGPSADNAGVANPNNTSTIYQNSTMPSGQPGGFASGGGGGGSGSGGGQRSQGGSGGSGIVVVRYPIKTDPDRLIVPQPIQRDTGLTISVDPGDRRSWPKAPFSDNPTLYDISGNNNHATLRNNPTWDGEAGGCFLTNGFNQYYQFRGDQITKWCSADPIGRNYMTWEVCFKTSDTSGQLISKPWNGSGQYNITFSPGGLGLYDGNSYNASFTSLADGNWHHIIIAVNRTTVTIYKDGVQIVNQAHGMSGTGPSVANNDLNLCVGTLYPYGGWFNQSGHAIQGKFGIFRLYDYYMQEAEALVNFESLRGRYGL